MNFLRPKNIFAISFPDLQVELKEINILPSKVSIDTNLRMF